MARFKLERTSTFTWALGDAAGSHAAPVLMRESLIELRDLLNAEFPPDERRERVATAIYGHMLTRADEYRSTEEIAKVTVTCAEFLISALDEREV